MAGLPALLFLLVSPAFAGFVPVPYSGFHPQSFAWDESQKVFLFGSLFNGSFFSISVSSDGAEASESIRDRISSVRAEGSSISAMAVDPFRRRLWIVAHMTDSFSSVFGAVGCYDLDSKARVFLTAIDGTTDETSSLATDVNGNTENPNQNYATIREVNMRPSPIYSHIAVASSGDAYVTDLERNRIFKICRSSGSISIFSESSVFMKSQDVPRPDAVPAQDGLSGIVAISEKYLLVVQPRSGRLFRVSLRHPDDVRIVDMDVLVSAQGLAARNDGILVAVSSASVWAIKSRDEWSSAYVLHQLDLNPSLHASAVCLKTTQRNAFILQLPQELSSDFSLQEIELPNDPDNNPLWLILILVAVVLFFGLYKLQMRYFLHKYNKRLKRN